MKHLIRMGEQPPVLRVVESAESDRSSKDLSDYWDAVPRDGPWVFLADAERLGSGIIHGRWIDPSQPVEVIREQLEAALGAEIVQKEAWAVIDQVNMGPVMLPDHVSLDELQAVARLQGAST